MIPLNQIRRAINPILRASGYAPWHTDADYPKARNSTMTAGISQRYGNGFVLSCGCDADLPTEERDRLWWENGEKLIIALEEAGFRPDVTPWGAHQRRVIVVQLPEG